MSKVGPNLAFVAYCSYGANPGVNITVIFPVLPAINDLAAPKSTNTTLPSPQTMMFSGFMSRCK
jgi:hypothetical protein